MTIYMLILTAAMYLLGSIDYRTTMAYGCGSRLVGLPEALVIITFLKQKILFSWWTLTVSIMPFSYSYTSTFSSLLKLYFPNHIPTRPKTHQYWYFIGDGRDDLCYVVANGETRAWLNTGAGVIPDYYPLNEIAAGASVSLGDKVYLGDFTGEGRADYMIVGDGGKVYGLVNRLQQTTLAPRWLGSIVLAEGPAGAKQEEVRLVDMTGDGKVDYLLVGENGKVTLWENIGTGGKYQPGEGVVLCDRKFILSQNEPSILESLTT